MMLPGHRLDTLSRSLFFSLYVRYNSEGIEVGECITLRPLFPFDWKPKKEVGGDAQHLLITDGWKGGRGLLLWQAPRV